MSAEKGSYPEPVRWSSRMYIRISRRDIAFFKFLIESWDNLAYQSIIDKHAAVLQIRYTPCVRRELLEFLEQISGEIHFAVEDNHSEITNLENSC